MDTIIKKISRDGNLYVEIASIDKNPIGVKIYYKHVLLQSTLQFSNSSVANVIAKMKRYSYRLQKMFKHIENLEIKSTKSIIPYIKELNSLFGKSVISEINFLTYKDNPTNINSRDFNLIILSGKNQKKYTLSQVKLFLFTDSDDKPISEFNAFCIIYYFMNIPYLKRGIVNVSYLAEKLQSISIEKQCIDTTDYNNLEEIFA